MCGSRVRWCHPDHQPGSGPPAVGADAGRAADPHTQIKGKLPSLRSGRVLRTRPGNCARDRTRRSS
jgi:hypothetical protein